MNTQLSPAAEELLERLRGFVYERVIPAESQWIDEVRQAAAAGNPHCHPQIVETLKQEARSAGLWNLFLPDAEYGAGLTMVEYATMAELLGRTRIGSEACNCSAPDTGNMEILHEFASAQLKQHWLQPLLDGEIRSGFAMTEPDVASSDATNIGMAIDRDGEQYVLNGRKWWTTGALHPNARVLVVMGKTDVEAPVYQQQSMVIVPIDTPGLQIVRSTSVFGYHDPEGHGELKFEDVRVPVSNVIGGEGMGFAIGQARLGPGRVHHCMRAIGVAERALEMLCDRADDRITFGKPISHNANVRDWIADSRVELEMARLLVMKAAWMMDSAGNQSARTEIAAIKVAVPSIALKVVDRAIQVHGGGGVSDDFPLAYMYAGLRSLRIADGPDEVHRLSIASQELRRQRQRRAQGAASAATS